MSDKTDHSGHHGNSDESAHTHPHSHDHPHPHQPDEEDTIDSHYKVLEIALRELLVEKSVVSEAELRSIQERMDRRGPHNGALMIARASTDPD